MENSFNIINGDSLIVLKSIENDSIDMIFADPPYNLSNGGTTCHSGKRVKVDKGDWDKSRGFDDDINFHSAWISECRRVLKPIKIINSKVFYNTHCQEIL